MLIDEYFEKIHKQLQNVLDSQREKILSAAEIIADSLLNRGLLHVFGTGHTMMIAEEIFYRAGELVPVNAMLDPGVSVREGATKSTQMERLEGYAKIILDNYDTNKGEAIIIASNSGINNVPIEMAIEAKKRGLKVIVLTSIAFSKSVASRHAGGKRLLEIADLVIDNLVPPGDAIIQMKGMPQKIGPISTIVNDAIIHAIIIKVAENMLRKGVTPPVWMSANLEKGDEFNAKYIKQYKGKIKHL